MIEHVAKEFGFALKTEQKEAIASFNRGMMYFAVYQLDLGSLSVTPCCQKSMIV